MDVRPWATSIHKSYVDDGSVMVAWVLTAKKYSLNDFILFWYSCSMSVPRCLEPRIKDQSRNPKMTPHIRPVNSNS